MAALEYLGTLGKQPDRWCICADLVHLRPEGARLYLMPGAALELDATDAGVLFAELAAQCSDPGWEWLPTGATRALLSGPDRQRIQTSPIARVAGADVDQHLPTGPDATWWHGFMNECQMQLFASEVNRVREQGGAPPANSVWFWGGGRVPSTLPNTWDLVFTEQPVLKGLATLAKSLVASPPGDCETLLKGAEQHARVLLTGGRLASLFDPGYRRDDGDAVQRFDEAWVTPAIRALRDGRLREFRIVDGHYGEAVLTNRDLRRWWPSWSRWRSEGR